MTSLGSLPFSIPTNMKEKARGERRKDIYLKQRKLPSRRAPAVSLHCFYMLLTTSHATRPIFYGRCERESMCTLIPPELTA